jgi:hypothetical protein
MIDKYRLPSLKKWDDIIRAIDDNSAWPWMVDVKGILLNVACGYCDYGREQAELHSKPLKYKCYYCPLPIHQMCCTGEYDSFYKDFITALENRDRKQARKIAVKIKDYIKNDQRHQRCFSGYAEKEF